MVNIILVTGAWRNGRIILIQRKEKHLTFSKVIFWNFTEGII